MTASSTRRVGLVQQRGDGTPAENLARAEAGIRAAAARGATVVCLQELFLTPYPAQSEDADRFDWAEPIPGPTTDRLSKLAAELRVVIVAPLFERRAPGLYHNSAAVIDADGQIVGLYRKMHIPDDPYYYEKYYFAPGDLGFLAFDTAAGRIGVAICWDQWFPESARLLALDGAEILFFPTAIGFIDGDSREALTAMREAWITVQRSHAIASGVFVAAPNRVGREGALEFWGSSFVADPMGRILAQSPMDAEDVLVVDCPPHAIEQQRRNWPFLRDRRVDDYDELLERFRR